MDFYFPRRAFEPVLDAALEPTSTGAGSSPSPFSKPKLPHSKGRGRGAVAASGAEYAATVGLLRYAVRTSEREEEALSISSLIKKILGM